MRRYLLTLMMMTGLCGCEQQSIDEPAASPYSREVINIQPQADGQSGEVSRGTPITSAQQMTDMAVFCAYTGTSSWSAAAALNKMFNTKLIRNTTTNNWQYFSTPINWGASSSSDKYSFFAYAPYASALNGITVLANASTPGIPSISYFTSSDVRMQPDLMIAVPRYDLTPATSMVALQMKHALTCVGFQIKGNGEKIKSISISGVYASGTVKLDGSAIVWSNLTAALPPASFSPALNYDAGQQYVTAQPTLSTNLLAADGYLMMIPQTLGPNAVLTLTLSDNTYRQIKLNSQTWTAGSKVTYNIITTPLGVIVLTPSICYLPSQGSNTAINKILLSCTPENTPWELVSNQSWALLSTNINGSGASQSISGVGSATIYPIVAANTQTTERTASLTIPGISSTPVGSICQMPQVIIKNLIGGGARPIDVQTYVGAFWCTDEKGERIIRIPIGASATNTGTWSAWVAWQDGNWQSNDIVFSTDASIDANISYTTDVIPGDAESYPVAGSNSMATGTVASGGTIYFRLGLKSTYTATTAAPARYAVVALSYGNRSRTQLIFLRQGEGADYVMRNIDPATGSYVNPTRPLARKFSPYNLTTSTSNNWPGGATITDHLQLLFQGGVFTEYPSQAGALFQWASLLRPRWAFHPTVPINAIGHWDSTYATNYWSAGIVGSILSLIHDVCPYGYKRMNDGPENTASTSLASTSEMRQSLFYNLTDGTNRQLDNITRGYYADGFFDRRRIKASTSGQALSVVSSDMGTNSLLNAKAAYTGTLFYNPISGASLFFPSAGVRNMDTGSLVQTGIYGFYWTASSKTQTNTSLSLLVGSDNMAILGNDFNRPTAQSIRCVKTN